MLLILSSLALAGDALTMEAVLTAQSGYGEPSVTFKPAVSGHIDVKVTCSGRTYTLQQTIRPGQDQKLTLSGLPLGHHHCDGALVLNAADGSSGQMPLSLDVAMLAALDLSVKKEELNLEEGYLTVRSDRPLSRVEVDVFGEGGALIGQGSIGGGGSLETLLEWGSTGGAEPVKLVVRAWDIHELPARLELSPWSYAIPHEDVHFATGKALITALEEPKLEAAWQELTEVVARYGSIIEVRLFVVGYTDTVGNNQANLELSERRAQAIARWFRNRGFRYPISYQGFGEEVLAVMTPDETDEPANRRALYLLAAEAPPLSEDIPLGDWKSL